MAEVVLVAHERPVKAFASYKYQAIKIISNVSHIPMNYHEPLYYKQPPGRYLT